MAEKGALLVINQQADFDPAEVERAATWLQDQGIPIYRTVTTRGPREVATAVTESLGKIDRLILGGGDGTISHAAETVMKSGLPLGILPMGTANDLARTLGLPRSIAGAFEVIAQGRVHRIDLGRVNGQLFFNVAHIGVGAEVTRSLDKGSKAVWGKLSYAKRAVDVFKKNRPFFAHVDCEGEHRSFRSIEIAIGNGRYYGGGMTVWDGAAIDDGELNLFYIKPRSIWKITTSLPAILLGKAEKWDWIRYMHGRHISIRTSRILPVSADGEVRTQTPVRFEVLPAALPVFVPAMEGK